MRVTYSLVLVARTLLDDPDGRHHGFALSKRTGVVGGVVHPVLARMLAQGWLTDEWENPAMIPGKNRPPRRYYQLTDAGRENLTKILRDAAEDPRFAKLNLARSANERNESERGNDV